MIRAAYDELPLADASAVEALIEELGLPQRYCKPTDEERQRFPRLGKDWDGRPFWARYLDDRVPTYKWTGKGDVWVTAEAKAGILRRVVMTGLQNETEAKALRAECWTALVQTGERLTTEDIERVAEELFNPSGYPHKRAFASVLRDLRLFFRWEGGEVVEGEGRILPISQLKLPVEDVDLLREVFRRLPPVGGPIKVRDGLAAAPPGGAKTLKAARERVKKLGGDFADEGFNAWVEQCLQTKTDKWTRSRAPLFAHYRAWIAKGGHGQNLGGKAEAKVTALPEQKWGRAMRRRFPDAWKQDKRSVLYKVTLKRGA